MNSKKLEIELKHHPATSERESDGKMNLQLDAKMSVHMNKNSSWGSKINSYCCHPTLAVVLPRSVAVSSPTTLKLILIVLHIRVATDF